MPVPAYDPDHVRDHYDRLSVFYRTFWGDHIHHGYWEGGVERTPLEAQEALVRRLADLAGVPQGAQVLDVGCGVGGSARWLARERGCSVDGITLSPVQAEIAAEQARKDGLSDRTRFLVHDARDLDGLDGCYDLVWVVECAEHLEEKAAFFAGCARRLRAGGALALCTWLRGDDLAPTQERLLADVCDGMLCPRLPSMAEVEAWLGAAGFEGVRALDATREVEATWDHAIALARRPTVRALLALSDRRVRRFVDAFPAMRQAYADGTMRYGMLTGEAGR